jgi:metal-responsive CopG/Arc/MetJ family transcriptional regulator
MFMAPEKNQRERISVCIDPELLAELERAAQEERRSISNMARAVLADWADVRKKFQQQDCAA